jgi:hypothetical protein
MVHETGAVQWPEFREYAREKYAAELDDDLITMIEDLIERRRSRGYSSKADNKSEKIKKQTKPPPESNSGVSY